MSFRFHPESALLLAALLPLLPLRAQEASPPGAGELKKNPPAARIPPKILDQEPPEYPQDMKASGIKGMVTIEFIVDLHGQVQNPVAISSNNPNFEEPAIRAVSSWKFKPATVDGRTVNTKLRVPVIFELEGIRPGRGADEYSVQKVSGSMTPPVLRNVLVPVYPYELRRDRITGHANARMVVDPAGKVARVEIVEATRPEFAAALTAALEGMAFSPAVKAGQPTAAVVTNNQKFDDRALDDPAGDRLLRLEKNHPESIHPLQALDGPLKPVSRRAPLFPKSLLGQVDQGEATVEFLIDDDGHARLPRVVAADNPAFGYAAVEAVASWIFEAPLLHKKEVVARAQIPFRFKLKPADSH